MEFIKKYYGVILFAIIIVISFFLFQTCSTLKTEREQREYIEKQNAQNLSALNDTLTVRFDKKLKAFIYEKDNFVVNKLSELEKYNQSLYSELKKMKGDVVAAIDSKVSADLGNLSAGNELVTIDKTTNNFGLRFKSDYVDPGFEQHLEGISKFYAYPDEITKKWIIKADTTLFTTNLTNVNIKYGFEDLDDKYKVWAISPSSKIKINQLDGVFIIEKSPKPMPEKPKKWAVGPYVGFGLNTDPNLSNPRFGWSIGMSVHYDIWQWRFGKK